MSSRALSLATVLLLIGFGAADTAFGQATNLEAGKSPSQLFGQTCTACHKSPRGLLKTVSPGSLPGFLRQHYTTSPDMAGILASYLVSNGAADTRYQAKDGKDKKDGAREANTTAGQPPAEHQGRRQRTQETARPEGEGAGEPAGEGRKSRRMSKRHKPQSEDAAPSAGERKGESKAEPSSDGAKGDAGRDESRSESAKPSEKPAEAKPDRARVEPSGSEAPASRSDATPPAAAAKPAEPAAPRPTEAASKPAEPASSSSSEPAARAHEAPAPAGAAAPAEPAGPPAAPSSR